MLATMHGVPCRAGAACGSLHTACDSCSNVMSVQPAYCCSRPGMLLHSTGPLLRGHAPHQGGSQRAGSSAGTRRRRGAGTAATPPAAPSPTRAARPHCTPAAGWARPCSVAVNPLASTTGLQSSRIWDPLAPMDGRDPPNMSACTLQMSGHFGCWNCLAGGALRSAVPLLVIMEQKAGTATAIAAKHRCCMTYMCGMWLQGEYWVLTRGARVPCWQCPSAWFCMPGHGTLGGPLPGLLQSPISVHCPPLPGSAECAAAAPKHVAFLYVHARAHSSSEPLARCDE